MNSRRKMYRQLNLPFYGRLYSILYLPKQALTFLYRLFSQTELHSSFSGEKNKLRPKEVYIEFGLCLRRNTAEYFRILFHWVLTLISSG